MSAGHELFYIDPQDPADTFPEPEEAFIEPNGLIAYGGDLSVERLRAAYQRGIFPWYSSGEPILWWTPNPRTVFIPEHIHISRSLQRQLRKSDYRVSFNESFAEVITACAAPRATDPPDSDGWLLPEMRAAYSRLHEAGHAHSVEVWQNERLVGGLYGVDCGQVFSAESMFSRVSNASKIALVELARHLQKKNYHYIDAQVGSAHLYRMGAIDISRDQLLNALQND